MSGWDGFFNDMDMAIQRDGYQQAINIYEQRIKNLNEIVVNEQDTAAGIYGHRDALVVQLGRFDPNNPVIKDDSLIEKIKEAAVSAFRNNKPLYCGNATTAGSSFCIPGHEGPDKALAEALAAVKLLEEQLAATKQELKSANKDTATEWKNHAGTYAVQQVFFHALEQLVPDHPLVKDSELRKALSTAGVDVFIKNGYDLMLFLTPCKPAGKGQDTAGLMRSTPCNQSTETLSASLHTSRRVLDCAITPPCSRIPGEF